MVTTITPPGGHDAVVSRDGDMRYLTAEEMTRLRALKQRMLDRDPEYMLNDDAPEEMSIGRGIVQSNRKEE